MQLKTQKGKLLEAVQIGERIVGKKESLPVLSCVRIDAHKNLLISATNLESGIEITIPADVEEKGSVAVPAHILSQTLQSIQSDVITIHVQDGNLSIEARGSKTLIKALPHEEFPSIPTIEKGKKPLSIPKDKFLKGVNAVFYAASQSMIRPELGSVYVSLRNKSLTFAATDSFRLAEYTMVDSLFPSSEVEILIPLRHTIELQHILEKVEDEIIDVVLEEGHMVVMGRDFRFISRVIDATFPNYREIIPKKFSTEATLLKADFSEMLRKGRVFAGTEQHVGLHLYPKKKIFSATARSNEIGEMSDSLEAALSGDDIDINFHINYIADCLQSINADSLSLGFSGPGRPLVVTSSAEAGFTYLVMPLNR